MGRMLNLSPNQALKETQSRDPTCALASSFLHLPLDSWRKGHVPFTLTSTSHIWNHNHTTTVLRPFFQDHPGEPVPEENFWTLWCKGRLTEADTPTNWLGATPSGQAVPTSIIPHVFYRPDALPAAQPTVSKHWRHLTPYISDSGQ